MARYSFAFQDRETGKYIGDPDRKFELAFLDYFAMWFDNKEQLIRFLNLDPVNVSDIAIMYHSGGEEKLLPIFFDAPELWAIVSEMVRIPSSESFDSIYEALAVSYVFPEGVKAGRVQVRHEAANAISKILIYMRTVDCLQDLPSEAYRTGYLDKIAFSVIGNHKQFQEAMTSSYLCLRKAYMFLRFRKQFISGEVSKKRDVPDLSMSELVHNYKIRIGYQVGILGELNELSSDERTEHQKNRDSYETELLERARYSDEAYEELRALPPDRLDALAPEIARVENYRRRLVI